MDTKLLRKNSLSGVHQLTKEIEKITLKFALLSTNKPNYPIIKWANEHRALRGGVHIADTHTKDIQQP